MNELFKLANSKISNLINELSEQAKNITKKTESEEEQGKIALILLYYKVVLQGCINFGSDIGSFVKTIKDCSMDESDIALVLDKYCEKDITSSLLSDIDLYEKTYIDVDIKPADQLNEMEKKSEPTIDTEISENTNDVELDINDIFGKLDNILNETNEKDYLDDFELQEIDVDVKVQNNADLNKGINDDNLLEINKKIEEDTENKNDIDENKDYSSAFNFIISDDYEDSNSSNQNE